MEKQLHFSMCDSKCRFPSVCHLPSSKVHDQERMLVGHEKHCQPPEHGMLCTGPDTCMTFQHHLLQLWRALLQALKHLRFHELSINHEYYLLQVTRMGA